MKRLLFLILGMVLLCPIPMWAQHNRGFAPRPAPHMQPSRPQPAPRVPRTPRDAPRAPRSKPRPERPEHPRNNRPPSDRERREARRHYDGHRFDHEYWEHHYGYHHPFYFYSVYWVGTPYYVDSIFWFDGVGFVIVEAAPDEWYNGAIYVEDMDGYYVIINPEYPNVRYPVRIVVQ